MSESMRASVLAGVGRMEVRDVPRPRAGPRDLLLRVAAVGVCGTDFHIYSGESNYNLDARGEPIPLEVEAQILGHEITGVVEEVGAEVSGFAPGDRVVVDQGLNCLTLGRDALCEYCASGCTHQCEHYVEYGITGLPGGFADFLAVPGQSAVRASAELDCAHAALTEPLACVLYSSATVARTPARYSIGAADERRRVRTILVCGAGPAGLLFLQVLRNVVGFDGSILVTEVDASKRALAERFGAVTVDPRETDIFDFVLEKTGGRLVEYLIEATGSGPVFAGIPSLIRKQATVLKYGIGHGGVGLEALNQVHWKEPTFLMPVGASGRLDEAGRPTVYLEALRLIEEGRVDVGSLVTHRYTGLERVPAAFAGDHHEPGYVKAVAVL